MAHATPVTRRLWLSVGGLGCLVASPIVTAAATAGPTVPTDGLVWMFTGLPLAVCGVGMLLAAATGSAAVRVMWAVVAAAATAILVFPFPSLGLMRQLGVGAVALLASWRVVHHSLRDVRHEPDAERI